jgi:2,5-diketo-D-gluconate reductase A
MSLAQTLVLNDGHSIPRLGFGVWRLPDDETTATVTAALNAGYRHIDTAQAYGNEVGTGRAVRESTLPRRDIFVTSKLRTADFPPEKARASFNATMDRLGLDDLDLFLLHWPVPAHDLYLDAWKTLIDLRAQGRVRSIGVSNFLPEHLKRLIDETGVVPAVNQLELHPSYAQRDIRDFHAQHGIAIQCYSPLGGEGAAVLAAPLIAQIAQNHSKSPAQVVIRWHLQQGLIPLPKSATPKRIAENADVWDFDLSDQDMQQIATLDRADGKTLPRPEEMNTLF